jgi:hypothetical protein
VTAAADPHARLAGALYLAIIVCGLFGEVAVRGQIVVAGDAAATAENLLASQGLFRAGFAAETVMAICDVALAVLLYRLLRPVNRTVALMAAAFRLVQASVIAASLMFHYGALLALGGEGREELALLLIEIQGHGYDLGLIFFGVNSLLTGWLVARSGFLPRWLGHMLVAAGLVYVVGSSLRFLAPALFEPFQVAYIVPVVAETAFCLWLLIRGVDVGGWLAALQEGRARV